MTDSDSMKIQMKPNKIKWKKIAKEDYEGVGKE